MQGRRVAVIGSGSTGVQLVSALAGVAAKVTMFQRTRQWILLWPNRQYSKVSRACYRGRRARIVGLQDMGPGFEQFTAALTRRAGIAA
ncbi:pyridine nucleotide-disulfide oxidoreductase family protein [Mycobacterium ulcerans str. Harvey]|uniref:Pyridine nucleotide-disulfide oxidoreductase family protein n=1 Tax=Mycobacterium ulcerans str. Harvey TaxID=1299332 RepID=A0ABP3A6G5_MYCUL|nr:pyridine nucleotide-disulfide oxidoreductase family protein [Mycobacterium ulcerans str. Harvey]